MCSHLLYPCRWGHTPLDDAVLFKRREVQRYLEGHLAKHPDAAASYSATPAEFPQDNPIEKTVYEDTNAESWSDSFSSDDEGRPH